MIYGETGTPKSWLERLRTTDRVLFDISTKLPMTCEQRDKINAARSELLQLERLLRQLDDYHQTTEKQLAALNKQAYSGVPVFALLKKHGLLTWTIKHDSHSRANPCH